MSTVDDSEQQDRHGSVHGIAAAEAGSVQVDRPHESTALLDTELGAQLQQYLDHEEAEYHCMLDSFFICRCGAA